MSLPVFRKLSLIHFRNLSSPSVYKSCISLDKLYPTSSLNVAKNVEIPPNEDKKFGGYIPMNKIQLSFCKSSGPGGQNVNRVNTKVDLRFQLNTADWIPDEIRSNMKTKFRNQVNKEGYLILQSDRTRSQHLNTADALEKLREMIRICEPIVLAEPSEETLEKIRRRQEKSARERLRVKRDRHNVKSQRGAM